MSVTEQIVLLVDDLSFGTSPAPSLTTGARNLLDRLQLRNQRLFIEARPPLNTGATFFQRGLLDVTGGPALRITLPPSATNGRTPLNLLRMRSHAALREVWARQPHRVLRSVPTVRAQHRAPLQQPPSFRVPRKGNIYRHRAPGGGRKGSGR